MTPQTTRRRLLASGAAIGLAAVAGCTDAEEGGDPVWGTGPDEDAEEEPAEEGEERSEAEPEETELAEEVDHENPDGEVSFTEPTDGDEVTSPVEIEMEAEGFDVEPAEDAPQDGVGHLHVLIDEEPISPGDPIPFEEGYVHYEEGELEDELELEPGEYDLVAQASDDAHIAYDLTDEVTITVVDG